MTYPVSPFILEQLADVQLPSDARLSPDGATVAFVMGKANKPDKQTPHQKTIYVLDVASRKLCRFTGSASGTNEQPRWSPNSKKLAFLSNRAGGDLQVYVIERDGGEAVKLTDLHGEVSAPVWSANGEWVVFLYDGSLEGESPIEADPIVVDAAPRFNRVCRVNVETLAMDMLTPADGHVFEYALSADGKKLAYLFSSHPNPAESWYAARLYVVDVDGSGSPQQIDAVSAQMGRLSWSPDGQYLAFVAGVMSDEGNISGEVYVLPVEAAAEQRGACCITPGIDQSITWIEWRDEGILYASRQIDSAILGWIDPQTQSNRVISKGAYAFNGWDAQRVSVAENGTFAVVRESFNEPANVFLGNLDDGEWTKLTDLPLNASALPPLRVENRFWQHADGTDAHGFLVFPPDYMPGKPYPLFLHVHGGPSWGYVPRYVSTWERLMASLGCLVFMPNPRGSWGRGHAFQSANVGDLGGGDWQDIEAGVDALIAEGLVDTNRMAIGGWSYGGYLVAWGVTQTTRFRCAIAGASITSYEFNYGVVSNREWQTTMFGSNVYDDYDLHRSRSPIAFASRVKTPTLLVHGERDTLAPVGQAIEFHTALKHFGVPTQLVIYPREPHGFQERAHQIDLYQRMVGWVQRYLFD